ncbi:MAG: hypothetical protein OFPI_11840 [Osedax symbiont Rs2]|nr:MAG: hypothetical protein OFPI_11840 [Osedax symbiont Rs2]
MKALPIILRVIGVIQIVLGLFYLLAPNYLLQAMGHSVPEVDIQYPLAMLASRFLLLGAVMLYIAKAPYRYVLWIKVMVLIQCIDLAAGILHTGLGHVEISLSGFAMFNASWMIVLLLLLMPKANSDKMLAESN